MAELGDEPESLSDIHLASMGKQKKGNPRNCRPLHIRVGDLDGRVVAKHTTLFATAGMKRVLTELIPSDLPHLPCFASKSGILLR